MILNMFFTPFENSEVVKVEMFLRDETFLSIINIIIKICFHRKKNHFIVALLIMNLASIIMNLHCE